MDCSSEMSNGNWTEDVSASPKVTARDSDGTGDTVGLCGWWVRYRVTYVDHDRHIKGNHLRRLCARTQGNPPLLGNFKVGPTHSV